MRRPIIALLPFALSALALAAGCSDDTSGQAAPVDRTSISKQLAETHCNSMAGCCDAAAIPQDVATCIQNAEAYFDEYFAEQDARNQTYDAQNAGNCVAAYGTYLSKCGDVTTEEARSLSDQCRDMYVGKVPVGGSCTADSECAGDDVDCSIVYDDVGDVASGTCVEPQPRAHGKQGDTCYETCTNSAYDTCSIDVEYEPQGGEAGCYTSDGLWCANDGTCQPLGKAGDACEYGGCVEGLFCDGDSGVCSALRGEGQPCSYASYDACQEGLMCNGTECVAPGGAGAPCEYSDECESGQCTDSNVCAANNASKESCSGLIGDDD